MTARLTRLSHTPSRDVPGQRRSPGRGGARNLEMAGRRDVLIHAYDRVDLKEVWITLSEQLPVLLLQIEPVLSV